MVIGLLALTFFGGLKMIRIEHNAETNEITQIELTAQEIKNLEALYKVKADENKADEAKADAQATAKAALLSKLGITAEEARLLLA